ncbi:AraC family transcriptional regulator [Paenibacillus luteus]|uniref:AraC family transcriptional regulator n=1 Tax=Paenibacillus luteus TaxID=2545753 RepID=UPI0013754383|nr:helix-turn-helix domain-containing protein [Paenibacillus luteus]
MNKGLLTSCWFRIVDCYRELEGSNYRLKYEASPRYALIVSTKRHGIIIIDGMLYPQTPNTVYFVSPGQRVETNYTSDGEQVLYVFHLEIISEVKNSDQPSPIISGLTQVNVAAETLLLSHCEKIFENWTTIDPADRFASQAGFQDLLHLLFKKQGQHETALDQARNYMNNNFQEAITVEELSELAGMSRYYFMRSFKEQFGQSAMDYLSEVRTNQAKRLMNEGQTLQKVAEKVGYIDRQYFSSQFKKLVGMSPSMYNLNRKSKIAAYSWPNIGHLLSLKIIPYAAPIDQTWTDEYRKRYRFDIKVPLSHDYEFNREALWRARPDRIIALEEMIPDEEKEKLREIAPVMFLPWHRESWRMHLLMTAQFLDREKEAEKWLTRYDLKVGGVLENIPASFRQGRLLILNIVPRGIKVWGKRAGTVLYDDLKIHCATGVEQIEFTEYVETGQLATFDADLILINVMIDWHSQTRWDQLHRSEQWQKLKAVRNHNVHYTAGHSWLAEPIMEYTAHRHYHWLEELNQLFCAL